MATYKSKYTGVQIDDAIGKAFGFDTDNDGLVDTAKNAERLGGQSPEFYATNDHTHTALDIGAATTITYTATIGTDWVGVGAPYTQEIALEGILASDNPIVDVIVSEAYDVATMVLDDWSSIYKITTSDGKLTVYSAKLTTQAINIQLKVIR